MSEEQGIVIRLKKDGMADVLTERGDACGNCSSSHCCTAIGSGSNKMVTRALNRVGARAGDEVTLSLRSGIVVKGAAIVYVLPIMGFIAGAAVGASVYQGVGIGKTPGAILFGLAGLAVGFLITVLLSRWMGEKGILTPEIAKVIKHGVGNEINATVDPVCHMLVDPAAAAASLAYKGTTYYFCNPGCKQAFSREPEKYLQ